MDVPKDCTECGNNSRCLKLIERGMVPYCGSSLCKPNVKEEKMT